MADGHQMAGLQMQMAPGWHTYWRAPGDAGIPPSFDWSGSQNVAAVRIHWPRPQAFSTAGTATLGYAGDLVLPLEITPVDASRPVRLKGRIDVGVCEEICVPASFMVDAALPRPGAEDAAIQTALRRRPLTPGEGQVSAVACSLAPGADGLRLTAEMTLPDTGAPEVVAVETGQPDLYVSPADVVRNGDRLTATVDVIGNGAPVTVMRDALVLTVLGTRRAVEIRGCPAG